MDSRGIPASTGGRRVGLGRDRRTIPTGRPPIRRSANDTACAEAGSSHCASSTASSTGALVGQPVEDARTPATRRGRRRVHPRGPEQEGHLEGVTLGAGEGRRPTPRRRRRADRRARRRTGRGRAPPGHTTAPGSPVRRPPVWPRPPGPSCRCRPRPGRRARRGRGRACRGTPEPTRPRRRVRSTDPPSGTTSASVPSPSARRPGRDGPPGGGRPPRSDTGRRDHARGTGAPDPGPPSGPSPWVRVSAWGSGAEADRTADHFRAAWPSAGPAPTVRPRGSPTRKGPCAGCTAPRAPNM